MKKLIYIIIILFITTSCSSTKYTQIPLSTPPKEYKVKDIRTQKDLVKEYQILLKHNLEWYYWYNIQVGSNYYRSKKEH